MMQANPFNEHIFTVQEKAFVRVKAELADTKWCGGFVHNAQPTDDATFQCIQVRRIR